MQASSVRTNTRPITATLSGAAGLALLLASGLVAPGAAAGSLAATELALSALCTSTALGLLALCGSLLVRRPIGDTLGLARGRLNAKSVAALVAGTAGVSHLLDWCLRGLGIREQGVLETIERALADASGWTLLLCLAGAAVAPGICEELLFRGLLLRSVARRAGVAAGILGSAALFGALHADLAQGCAAALLGVYLGAVAVASGSTRTSMACHIANNTAAVLVAAFGSRAGSGLEPALLVLASGGALAGLTTLWGEFRGGVRARLPAAPPNPDSHPVERRGGERQLGHPRS